MFDAHTHLNSDTLYTDRKQHAYDFIDAGGTHLVTVGIDTHYNIRNIEICTQRLQDSRASECVIKSSVGIHPCSAGNQDHATQAQIDTQLTTIQSYIQKYPEHIVAVGECGIDAHRGDYTTIKSLQRYTFEKQCQLAQQCNLPIIIHSRSQRPDTLAILRQFPDLKIYLHCRGYTPQEVQQAATHIPHLWIGFCGNTTYPKAQSLRDSLTTARSIQSDGGCHVLIETDAPYLAPQAHRGKMNTPAYLATSGESFAGVLGIQKERVFTVTTHNSKELYDRG